MFLIRLLTKIFLNFCGINKKSKMQTTMKKNNLNPAWKESFDIDWHGEEIIQIECWDHNKVSNLRHSSNRKINLSKIIIFI